MKIVAGSGQTIVVIATVHAENEELAGTMTLEQVTSETGEPVLRVIYPVDRYSRYRFPGGDDGGSFLGGLFGDSSTSAKYAGHKVKVTRHDGVLLYADVEVQVPRRAVNATFRNVVGPLRGEDIEGTLLFDASSGDVTLARVRGDVKADTGSGDVKASDLQGSYSCDTGSGDCDLTGFTGEKISCDTGSGDIKLRSATADRIDLDTGSGNIEAVEVDVVEFSADTGSGDVELGARGRRLSRVAADTGSGDVTLRLDPDATFEAKADQGSGDLVVRYSDAQPILNRREVIGYRRGDARIRIQVDTGSGDVVIEPGS
jgi:DUF4097 and DUF4098 domain-containing protein YvlB